MLNADQVLLLNLLRSDRKVCLMAAPSFPVDFDFRSFVSLMKSFGFDKVTELTFGAKIVNKLYREFIIRHPDQLMFISSACPSIVNLVRTQCPELVKFLIPVDSPMIAMAKINKRFFKEHAIVFLSPCHAKKVEAKSSGFIDCVVTFSELLELINDSSVKLVSDVSGFDSFINEFTKIYPVSGGLALTLNSRGVLSSGESLSLDDCRNVKSVLNTEGIKFFDLLFCKGGCIGGSGVACKDSVSVKREKIINYKLVTERQTIGKKRGLNKHVKGIDFKREF